ncbi:Mediator of DNA damage checkpoint protein 1 [Glycine soja]
MFLRVNNHVANDATHVTRSSLTYKVNNSSTGKVGSGSSKERLEQYDKKRKVDVKSELQTSGLSKKSTKEVRQWTKDNMMTRSKRSKLNAEGNQTSRANENGRVSLSPIIAQRKSAGALKRHQLDELNNPGGNNGEGGGSSVSKRHLQDDVLLFTPIARKTRRSLAVNPLINVSDDAEMDILDCPKGRRSLRIRKLSNDDKLSETLVGSSKPSAQPDDIGKYTAGKRKMRTDSVVKSQVNCQARSSLSLYDGSAISSVDRKQGKISELNSDKANPGDNINNSEVTTLDESPRERYKSSDLASATPAKCKTPVNDASPVCMGDEYYKQSCNRNLSRSCKELHRELQSLRDIRSELLTPSKDSRKRRDMTDVRILYSHHLDEDIVKHQKKILARLGVSVASSIADATHFIANQFVRTRNMLEAIAFGKPVVTHLWIESCGQASCFIDERNYILRDVKKEKELGFSMPVSLAHAIQHPLLKGRRVLVTTNTKPNKEIVSNLTRAVQGQDDGEIEGDVNHRIQAGWMKWRKTSGVLCDAKVPIKLKGKFYRTAVRPAILYGTECWAVKSQHENKVGVAEMRMLRWMCDKTRQDKIRNEAIRERVGIAPIVEKMVENRLRWFGHVERRPVDSVVRRVDQMERRQTIRGRGRPKKTIREVIKKDLEINGLDRSMVVEKVGRSVFKGDTISDDLLILSCEEDYASCVPFLEKGAMVYSSELLLNGIVTQKLEYQRHRLFADIVKKTRSTLWLKRDDRTFIPVTKCN